LWQDFIGFFVPFFPTLAHENLCKARAIKLACIAELQPNLFKERNENISGAASLPAATHLITIG